MAEDVSVTPAARRPARTAPATSFTGLVLQDPMLAAGPPSMMGVTNVTFAPGARTFWHTHEDRQVLVVQSGTGVLQAQGQPPQLLRAGDVATIPPGLVHWHGATAASLFTHTSLVHGGPSGTTWMHPVDDADYAAATTLPTT